MPDPFDLSTAFIELQNLLLQAPDVDKFLSEVAVWAAAVPTPSGACGITLRRNGEVSTVAASGLLASRADEVQYGHGQGPCLHSLHSGETVLVTDMEVDDRWNEYRRHAYAEGVRSSLSIPLAVDGEIVGALNIYTDRTHAFSETEIVNARAFGAQAAAALTLVMRHSEQLVLEDQLRAALESRAVIDQALGIIMSLHSCNATKAFQRLRSDSQNRNLKLALVAAELITQVTGEAPKPPQAFVHR